MAEISVQEKDKIKDYALRLAKEYEKAEFGLFAAELYQKFEPEKAKKIYEKLAKKAEKNGFLLIAARIYCDAHLDKKARETWNKAGKNLQRKGLDLLAKEAFNNARPIKKDKKLLELLTQARKFKSEGKFKESIKFWGMAAKHEEQKKNFQHAFHLYLDAHKIKDAERCWRMLKNK